VDGWLGDNITADSIVVSRQLSNKSKVTGNANNQVSDHAPASKAGLGYRGKPNESKGKDALEVRLGQNKRQKASHDDEEGHRRKQQNATSDGGSESDDDDMGVNMHGIVEDVPVSKSSIGKRNPVVQSTKRSMGTGAKDIGNKKSRPSNELGGVKGKSAESAGVDTVTWEIDGAAGAAGGGQRDGGVNNDSRGNSNPPHSHKHESADGNNSNFKRKRTKTRSKQKNIRKDNRPDAKRPAYLQAGAPSEEYKGRVLTEETKRRLGIQ
jgi:hypothetical protein